MATKIEWTEETWNPIAGCTKCSPGCDNCYAERMANRLNWMGISGYEIATDLNTGKWTGHVTCIESKLDFPLHWRKPRQIFVNSMSDTFHEKVPFKFIEKIWDVMLDCMNIRNNHVWSLRQYHTFQILTKRIDRALEFSEWMIKRHNRRIDYSNIWLGVTVCTPEEKPKIDILRQIPAAVRFISFEPLLADMGDIDLEGISWCIVGGESGPNARPVHPDWARGIRDQCIAAGVPFFFKQWGEYTNDGPGLVIENDVVFLKDGTLMDVKDVMKDWRKYYDSPTDCVWMKRIGKKKAGSLLDGKEWKQYPKDTK